jgi:hypothetical protein
MSCKFRALDYLSRVCRTSTYFGEWEIDVTDRDNVLAMSRFFIMLCGRLSIAAHFETIIALSEPMILLAKNLQDTERRGRSPPLATHCLGELEKSQSGQCQRPCGPTMFILR